MNKIELEENIKDLDNQIRELQDLKMRYYEDYIKNDLGLVSGTRFIVKNGYYMNKVCQMIGHQAFVLNKDNSINKRMDVLRTKYLTNLDKDDFEIIEQEVK